MAGIQRDSRETSAGHTELGTDDNGKAVDMFNANWKQEGIEKNYRL